MQAGCSGYPCKQFGLMVLPDQLVYEVIIATHALKKNMYMHFYIVTGKQIGLAIWM